MLKTIASFVPEEVQVVCARVSSWFPEKDTSLGDALSREVREGRMIDSFTKYLRLNGDGGNCPMFSY